MTATEIVTTMRWLFANKQYEDLISYFEVLVEHAQNNNQELFQIPDDATPLEKHTLALHEYHAWSMFAKSLYKRKLYTRSLRSYRTCSILIELVTFGKANVIRPYYIAHTTNSSENTNSKPGSKRAKVSNNTSKSRSSHSANSTTAHTSNAQVHTNSNIQAPLYVNPSSNGNHQNAQQKYVSGNKCDYERICAPPIEPNVKIPDKNELRYETHLCLLKLNKTSDAIAMLESINSHEREPKVLLALAEMYSNELNSQLASLNYRELIRRSPMSLNAIKQLCRLNDEGGLLCDDIIKLVQPTSNSASEWMPDWIGGNYYLQSAQCREAIKHWERLYKKFNRSPAIQTGLAQSLYHNGDYRKAVSHYRIAYKIDHLYVNRLDSYAACLVQQSEFAELDSLATRMVEKCEKEGEYMFEPWIVLGYYHHTQLTQSASTAPAASVAHKEQQKAFNFVQKAQKINPLSVEAAILHAKLHYDRRDFSKAISQATFALSQAPYRFEVHKIICEAHVGDNRKATAIKYAQAQIKQFGETARSLHLFAKTLLSGSDTRSKKNAKIYLEKALKVDPTHEPSLFELAGILIDEKSYDRAIEILESCALDAHSTNSTVHECLSQCYLGKKDHEKALEHKNLADRLTSAANSQATYNIGSSSLGKSSCSGSGGGNDSAGEDYSGPNILDADSNLDLDVNDLNDSDGSETDAISD